VAEILSSWDSILLAVVHIFLALIHIIELEND